MTRFSQLRGRSQRRIDKVASRSYFEKMQAVGLKTLKNKLAEYVRMAAAGETVLVTDRGRVVAELGPRRAERSPILADAFLAEMVRKGWLTLPTIHGDEPPAGKPVAALGKILEDLNRDREDR